jgi:L-threonylcarbamoyladenylate synthase
MSSSKHLTVGPQGASPEAIREAALALRNNELVVAPTDTRYGLLARADNVEALDLLRRVKMRGEHHAVAVFARSRAEIEQWGEVNERTARLIETFLPGPLTLVLKAKVDWPSPAVVNGRLGIRWSSSPLIQKLLAEIDTPITATSANLSGRAENERVQEIREDFGDAVAVYLDAGVLKGAISTVVDCTRDKLVVLRGGAIAAEDIDAAADRT